MSRIAARNRSSKIGDKMRDKQTQTAINKSVIDWDDLIAASKLMKSQSIPFPRKISLNENGRYIAISLPRCSGKSHQMKQDQNK